jgi:uncharacterized integral membrane protein
MQTTPTLEEQAATAGLTYGRRHDISYRTGFVIQMLGSALLAVLYPLESPFYTVGIMVFEIGVLLSSVYLLVRRRSIKKFIVASVMLGLVLQVAGSITLPEQYAGLALIAGIGLVCAGAGGMAGKEAYCFGYREGWLLMPLFLVMVLVNLLGKENHILNSLGFSVIFLLLLSLTGKKLRQKLLSKCAVPERGQK